MPMLALDLGGTLLRVALYDNDAKLIFRSEHGTAPDNPNLLGAAMTYAMRIAKAERQDVKQAIIGVPGWVDYASNAAVTLRNLPEWGRIEGSELASKLGLEVILANDADLAALGEHRLGAGVGCDDLVYVTCSTGVGAGVILGGQLVRGKRSITEIGHTVIDWQTGDTVEGIASGTAVAAAAGIPAKEVAARAAAGDAEAQAHFRRAADALAVGVLNLAFLFGPERIVIGGGMAEAGDLLLGPVRERFAAETSPLLGIGPDAIVHAQGGQDAGLLGALAYWQAEFGPKS